jgi:hypothetical protein
MSNLLNNPAAPVLSIKDRRLVPNFQVIRRERDRVVERNHATEMPSGYKNTFWPGNRGFVGDRGLDVGIMEPVWSRLLARLGHGEASRVGFVGVTRDQYGAPLGGVTCSLFLTATRQWIMDIVSDANGGFLLQSFYSPDTHFIVFNKAGSPNVYGATDQNLVGA